jgi:AcrR family transcriptional regulator
MSAASSDPTKVSLIKAALKVFAQKGRDGTSVKDLADEAGVNVSLISYHFGGKDGLYRACLEGIGREKLESTQKLIGEPPRSRQDFDVRMRMFIKDFLEFHAANYDASQILSNECPANTALIRDIFDEFFFETFMTCTRFVEAAMKKKWLPPLREPTNLASCLFGSLAHNVRFAKLSEEKFKRSIFSAKTRDELTDDLMSIFFPTPNPESKK